MMKKTEVKLGANASTLEKVEKARALVNALDELLGVEFDDDDLDLIEIPVGDYEDLVTDERYREDYYMEHKIMPKYLKPYDFKADRPIATK
jgi:hypothetical protein